MARTSKAVALDLGARRIGVAVSDAAGSLAFPRPHIARQRDRALDFRAIAEVVDEVGASVVVVGLPLSLDGGRGAAACAAEEEARELARFFAERGSDADAGAGSAADAGGDLGGDARQSRGVEVTTFDERLTTVTADAALGSAGARGRQRRMRVDSAAATVLLQSWLESR